MMPFLSYVMTEKNQSDHEYFIGVSCRTKHGSGSYLVRKRSVWLVKYWDRPTNLNIAIDEAYDETAYRPRIALWASCKIRKIVGCACAGNVFLPPRVTDTDMHHDTCVTHVLWCMPGSQTSGFLWIRWRGKRSRHSRSMRNTHFYVSGKRPMAQPSSKGLDPQDPILCT